MRSATTLPIIMLLGLGVAASAAAQTSQTATDTFEVRIALQGTCTLLTASDIDFGTQVPSAGTHDQAGTINVQCTRDTPFTLGLDGGTTTGQINARAMVNTPVSPALPVQIPYTLSRDSFGGAIWGNDAGSNWYVGSGLGIGAAYNIALTVYGRATLAGNEPPGTYTDTVTATLTY